MIVGNFFLFSNQTDAPIIQIYSALELYMFRATSLPIIRCLLFSVLVSFMQVLMTAPEQSQDETPWSGHQNLHETYQYRM
jgi:hypothetical protein